MEENTNTQMTEEQIPVEEMEFEEESSNGGLLIGAGLGVLATLGAQWVYKKAIKPGVGKIKDKIAARKNKSQDKDAQAETEDE